MPRWPMPARSSGGWIRRAFMSAFFAEACPIAASSSGPTPGLFPCPNDGERSESSANLLLGRHDILFYVKASPASRLYLSLRDLGLRRRWKDGRITIGTVESQSDLRNEPTIAPEAVHLWERTVLRCDYLFSNSAVGETESAAGVRTCPARLCPPGVDTSFFTPAWDRPANPRPRVLFVGSLRPFKQPQLLLDAAARFPGADFVMVGEGLMADELKARIEREQLRNVTLAGLLGAEQLKQQYQQADIFLFPSTVGRVSEGFAGSGGVRPAGDCAEKLSAGNRS